MTKKLPYTPECDVALAMSILGGKWKIAIIWKLVGGRLRYSELKAKLGTITEGVFINQLKELEADGIVKRINHKKVPPHVEYELTQQGRRLERTLYELEQWGSGVRATLTVR